MTNFFNYRIDSSLEEIKLNKNVQKIEAEAFAGCKLFTTLTSNQKLTDIDKTSFNNSGLNLIYGYKDTYTQTYAQDNNIPFIDIEEQVVPEIFVGDVNGDGKVNIQDLMNLMYYISGMTDLNENLRANADINKDGKINIQDLMRLMYYISGKITEL